MRRFVVVVLTLAMFACAGDCRSGSRRIAREDALIANLAAVRAAIKYFREDKKRGPGTLEELTPDYLVRVPRDPMNDDLWLLVRSGQEVVDIRSRARGRTCAGRAYSDL
jgi:hypothetical protein